MNYGFEDKTLIELLEVIRFSAVDRSKRLRLRRLKISEVDAEFKKIVKTIRAGKQIAKTGYHYLHGHSTTIGDQVRITISVRLSTHGTKAVVTTANWKDFTKWVDGYYSDKPDNLEQWRRKYGKES